MGFFREVVETPLIPTDSKLASEITGATIEPAGNGNQAHIKVMHMVTQECEYKGATVAHKLHINDDNDKKAQRAQDMFDKYDKLAKGAFTQLHEAGQDIMNPNILQATLGGLQVLTTYNLWEMSVAERENVNGQWVDKLGADGNPIMTDISGNNVSDIAPLAAQQAKPVQQAAVTQPHSIGASNIDSMDDADIPF